MKRTITLIIAMTFALSMGGCSMFKKKSAEPAKAEQMDDKPMHKKHHPKKAMHHKKKTSKGVRKGKRILCNTKKTYTKGTACWHWKRGARIGKPAKK
ncbi:hypothetical protein MNBD_GAMMA12-2396 [hydrothermal vent metagenome]|uniref:Lipoprotein n=1 Tax=hydrothermal vent metagenome TaxID=652676 RepID=A0A3B0ZJB7_9ZZZZ